MSPCILLTNYKTIKNVLSWHNPLSKGMCTDISCPFTRYSLNFIWLIPQPFINIPENKHF